ncbi:conserved hypothetical protein [Ricinus communis]|uniref:Uncharacterized protein n=1 Tax=Ricinus communis TaxID=3988 RepID=B9SW25_RICCO|nr:conserved hypothetical protein [Ricinus communis]
MEKKKVESSAKRRKVTIQEPASNVTVKFLIEPVDNFCAKIGSHIGVKLKFVIEEFAIITGLNCIGECNKLSFSRGQNVIIEKYFAGVKKVFYVKKIFLKHKFFDVFDVLSSLQMKFKVIVHDLLVLVLKIKILRLLMWMLMMVTKKIIIMIMMGNDKKDCKKYDNDSPDEDGNNVGDSSDGGNGKDVQEGSDGGDKRNNDDENIDDVDNEELRRIGMIIKIIMMAMMMMRSL